MDWKNIAKMSILLKAVYKLNAILIKIPMPLFAEVKKKILKFIWNLKRRQVVKAIPREKSKAGGLMLPDFKIYYKTTVVKTVWNQHRQIYTYRGTESQK